MKPTLPTEWNHCVRRARRQARHGVLLTSEPANNFGQAWTIIDWYEKRQILEEYHKCLQTGCRVEHRQYKTSTRRQRVTGLLSLVAVRLLQRKSVARTAPERPAQQVVPEHGEQCCNA